MAQRPRIYYSESQKALMWELWQKGESLQQIAQLFDRNHSSIQRILAESGGQEGYRTNQADQLAWDCACRPNTCKLVENRTLAHIVAGKLQLQWSPQQMQAGSNAHTRVTRNVRCHTKPSIAASLSRLVVI